MDDTFNVLPFTLKADQVNEEYGKLHKTIFNFTFRKKNLDYDSLLTQTNKLQEELRSLKKLFESVAPASDNFYEPFTSFLDAELDAVFALFDYILGKINLKIGLGYSKEQDRYNFDKYYEAYNEYIKECKNFDKAFHKK